MEESRETIEKILSNASPIKAPRDLSQDVLKAWRAESKVLEIKPLLPRWFWVLLAFLVGALALWVVSPRGAVVSDTSLFDKLPDIATYIRLDLSPVIMISILAMALMIGLNAFLHSRRLRIEQLSSGL
ncbi:MAG: hypothetical protein HKO93_04265 [Flavobacteriales bacterium]|nr:hypothetical protein [Flavobacteriales bacterium]